MKQRMNEFFARIVIVACVLLCAISGANAEKWVLPNPDLPYDQVAWLVAHNAFSSYAYGYYPYAQQRLSITDQLKGGTRGFMLDIYIGDQKKVVAGKTPDLRLCHGPCSLMYLFRPVETVKSLVTLSAPSPELLKGALAEIRDFLDKNPQEIVTILYEDHVNDPALLDAALEGYGITDYILTPADWDAIKQQGWPTLRWLQEKNKRLIMFSDSNATDYCYYTWKYVAENQYSTIEKEVATNERSESVKAGKKNDRYLYLFNFFPYFPIPYKDLSNLSEVKNFWANFKKSNDSQKMNSTILRDALQFAVGQGINYNAATIGRMPNFVALDFVDEGDGIAIVNKINSTKPTDKTWAVIKQY